MDFDAAPPGGASLTSHLEFAAASFDPAATHLVGVLRGEGVGPEVVAIALDLLDILARHSARRIELREGGEIGLPAKLAGGRCLSAEVAGFAAEIFAEGGVLFCGPGGDRFVYELREEFDLFCKFTPIQPLAELRQAGAIRAEVLDDVDILAVRDNMEGIYQGQWESATDPAGHAVARHRFHYSEPVVTKLMTVAFRAAARRRQRLHVILKPGGVPSISALWRACYRNLASQFGEVEVFEQEVDNAVYQLVTYPRQFDVIISPNLFGDVMADCASALLASRGLSYSGNFNARGHAAYQTGHGAARDIAGLNIANPTGQIFSLAMMLRESFAWPEAAARLVAAVRAVLASGTCTSDVAMAGHRVVGTVEFGKAVADQLIAALDGERILIMADALLLVDTQRDYFERADLTPPADALTAAIARLLAAFRGRGRLVLHGHTLVAADGSDAMPHWRRAGTIWCRAGTPGALAPEGLAPLDDEPLLAKRFYSPFEDPALPRLLREHGITRLAIAGLYTQACVRSAVLDAYAHGCEVLLPTDAVASYDPAHAAMTIAWLDGRAARCLPADRIIAMLDEGQ